jgi:hypothetical protein
LRRVWWIYKIKTGGKGALMSIRAQSIRRRWGSEAGGREVRMGRGVDMGT